MSDRPSSASLNARLALLAADPVGAMARHPEKRVVRAPRTPPLVPLAPYAADGGFIERRDQVRQQARGVRDGQLIRLEQILPGRAPFLRNDKAEDVVDVPATTLLRKLDVMEAAGLRSAKLAASPWSSSYWPIYQGQLGARYADPKFPAAKDWQQNRTYVEQHPAAALAASADAAALDLLSPAEKYDLLVGDRDFTLTENNWEVGRAYYKSRGSVETWMGVCHGWAPAAYMLPRPLRPLSVVAGDGRTPLRFFPADLKALGCLLWATTNPNCRFVGGRCNDKKPMVDPQSGRTTSADCFDTNPGTWHLAVINQIGAARRSFIIDATFDYEVWNQPVFGYSYNYFNPRTRQAAATLAEATVARASFSEDPFARFRAQGGKSLVGVEMTLTYVAETEPGHQDSDSEEQDRLLEVTYLYDLELDAAGTIIGGEWYESRHPDFLWTPPPDGQALSFQDGDVEGVWGEGALPAGWRDPAIAAAAVGQPLASIVNTLFNQASQVR